MDKLLGRVPGLRYYRIDEDGMPSGVWFVFETSPLPPTSQIEMVIADLVRDGSVYLHDNGVVEHSRECKSQDHNIEDKRLKAAVSSITAQSFKIAVWENTNNILGGQPVILPLEPEITYSMFPDHPHINAGGPGFGYYMPESICYTDNPKGLGNNPYDRVLEAIEQCYIWLFKHQVWLATRNTGKGIWIGSDVAAKEKEQFFYRRDPHGKCWCGSNKEYCHCHLEQDFRYACESEPTVITEGYSLISFRNGSDKLNLELYNQWWANNVKTPQSRILAQLKRILQ